MEPKPSMWCPRRPSGSSALLSAILVAAQGPAPAARALPSLHHFRPGAVCRARRRSVCRRTRCYHRGRPCSPAVPPPWRPQRPRRQQRQDCERRSLQQRSCETNVAKHDDGGWRDKGDKNQKLEASVCTLVRPLILNLLRTGVIAMLNRGARFKNQEPV